MGDKVKEYLAGGVKKVWVVNTVDQTVTIYRPEPNKPALLSVGDELEGGNILPGFKLKLADIFDDIGQET